MKFVLNNSRVAAISEGDDLYKYQSRKSTVIVIRGDTIFNLKILFITVMLVFGFSSGVTANSQMVIQMISQDIKQAKDPKEKSSLHIYRARQYARARKYEEALDDYSTALELDHKGWIHLERSQFLLRMEKYELAYEDAKAAKEEVPTLGPEADKVIDEAVAVIRKQYEAENPETIILDTKVNLYRKTRFDIMRKQGVFSAKAARIASNSSRAKQKKRSARTKSANRPRARG